MHSEVKEIEISAFSAEKGLLEGHARRQVAHALKTPSYLPPPSTFKSQVMVVGGGELQGV